MIKNKALNINDIYHLNSKKSKRVINRNDFTYKEKISILEKFLNKNKIKNILDIGCGVGTLDFYLANKYSNLNIKAIDVSTNAINIAQENKKELKIKNVHFRKEDFLVKKNENKIKYDLIICNEVLEHLQNDRKAIKTIFALLKPKGRIIISVPSTNAPLYKFGLARRFDKRVGHLRRYSVDDIKNLISEEKFSILEIIETEGIVRNSLFILEQLGKLIRFIKYSLIDIVYFLDSVSIYLLGASDITIIAKKIS